VRQFKFEHLRDLVIQVRKLSPPENPATIVYERYVTRPTQHGNLGAEAKYQLSPVYVHGYLVGAMEQARFPSQMPTFHPQLASEMSAMPDNRLKAMFPLLFALTLGPAKPHGRDALRHLLVYLKRYRNSAYQGLKVPQDIG